MKKLFALILAPVASSLVLYALVSMDQPARHSRLRSAELPPLVPLHNLIPLADISQDHTAPSGVSTTVTRPPAESSISGFHSQLTLPQANPAPGPLPTLVLLKNDGADIAGTTTAETVLFLANRGYAVLELDCRVGTHGATTAVNLARGVVGVCSVATIADETRKLIKQGIADPSALALVGSGFGGTLVLLAISTEPELFKAAVVHSPAHNQTGHLAKGPVREPMIRATLEADVHPKGRHEPSGRSGNGSLTELLATSRAALLITHGNDEAGAPLDRAHARELMTTRGNIAIYDLGSKGQNYSRWQTRVEVARLTETFLARHLGGRNGGYDYIELLAKLF